jgi:hypothetical protein
MRPTPILHTLPPSLWPARERADVPALALPSLTAATLQAIEAGIPLHLAPAADISAWRARLGVPGVLR